jgi:hypothetical protein
MVPLTELEDDGSMLEALILRANDDNDMVRWQKNRKSEEGAAMQRRFIE